MTRLGWTAPLRRNATAKVFAALSAFVLWFFVNAGKRETQIFQFPLELRNVPANAVLVSRERIDTIAVKLNGPGALLGSLDARRAPIVLDLANAEPNVDTRLKIREDMVRVPRGVRILDIEPSRVPLRLETLKTATVPVRVVRSGEPPEGYRIGGVKVMPTHAMVSGPASAVDGLEAIETEPLDLNGLSASTQRGLSLVRGERLLAVTPERVLAQITVEEVRKTRELRAEVEVRNVDRPFQLRPTHVNLTVQGPESTVKDLKLEAGTVSVDGANLPAGQHTVDVEVSLPAGVELVKLEPTTLSLQIPERKDGARK